jgi:hypothetical protein
MDTLRSNLTRIWTTVGAGTPMDNSPKQRGLNWLHKKDTSEYRTAKGGFSSHVYYKVKVNKGSGYRKSNIEKVKEGL